MQQPNNLDECLAALPKLLGKIDTAIFKNTPEEEILFRYHHGLGKWLRNQWGLWQSSKLALHFKSIGVIHANDMSGLILHMWHLTLNSKPISFDKIVAHYRRNS